jgi:long-chain acyl-CoA synthetase
MTAIAWDDATTVPELLALRVAATPDALAFREETGPKAWRDVSWQSFADRVEAARKAFVHLGLARGGRVALMLPTSVAWEVMHHGAMSAGCAVVGFDAHDVPQRLAVMAEQAAIDALVVADVEQWTRLAAGGMRVPLVLLAGDDVARPGNGGPQALSGGVDSTRIASWPSALAAAQSADGAAPTSPPIVGADTATIIFTSGTTGSPKGIAYTHAQVCLAVRTIADAFSFAGTGSRLLCWLPLSNLFQRMVNLSGLRQGAVTIMLADPRQVMDVVALVEPDVFVAVPRFYEKLHEGIRRRIDAMPAPARSAVDAAWRIARRARAAQRSGRVPRLLALEHSAVDALVLRRIRAVMGSRLRCLVSGSAPMSRELLESFDALGLTVLEAYGLSENIVPMALNRLDDHRLGTVGRPIDIHEIDIRNDGRVLVRGPGVFGGYLGEPSADHRLNGEWYDTGDLGHFDADGYLVLGGRSNDIIKTSTGRRISPIRIEQRLALVAGVDQVVVIGAGRKGLVALCIHSAAANPDPTRRALIESQLRAAASELDEAQRPMAIGVTAEPFAIDAGELTPNLKLRRSAIAQTRAGLIELLYRRAETGSPGGLAIVWEDGRR